MIWALASTSEYTNSLLCRVALVSIIGHYHVDRYKASITGDLPVLLLGSRSPCFHSRNDLFTWHIYFEYYSFLRVDRLSVSVGSLDRLQDQSNANRSQTLAATTVLVLYHTNS